MAPRRSFEVIEVMTGRIRSRHTTEKLAWAAIDRVNRDLARMVNASRYQHGGLGQIVEFAVRNAALDSYQIERRDGV